MPEVGKAMEESIDKHMCKIKHIFTQKAMILEAFHGEIWSSDYSELSHKEYQILGVAYGHFQ